MCSGLHPTHTPPKSGLGEVVFICNLAKREEISHSGDSFRGAASMFVRVSNHLYSGTLLTEILGPYLRLDSEYSCHQGLYAEEVH